MRVRQPAWLIAALVIGLLARFWDLAALSLQSDEGWTLYFSGLAPAAMMHQVATLDAQPPLMYLATHYLMSWLHWAAWEYRYLIAPVGLVTILATWGAARRMFGDTTAAIAALLIALEPTVVQWDRLYRMYAPLTALTALSWWLLLIAEKATGRARPLWWLSYGLCVICLPYVHYLGALVVLSQVMYALIGVRTRWPVLALAIAGVAAFLPWLWAFRIQSGWGGLSGPVTLGQSWLHLPRRILAAGLPEVFYSSPAFDVVFSAAIIATLLAAIWLGRRTALPFWLLPIPLQAALSLALSRNFIVSDRYLDYAIPAVAVAFAAVATALLSTRARVAGAILMAIVVAMNVAGVAELISNPRYQMTDWYALNALMVTREEPSDVIVLDQAGELFALRDLPAFRSRSILLVRGQTDIPTVNRLLDGAPGRRVWYIGYSNGLQDPQLQVEHHLGRSRRLLGSWLQDHAEHVGAVFVVLYDKRAPSFGGS